MAADIETLTSADIINLCGGEPDVIWASPDCATYSVAGIHHHRRKNKSTGECEPISEYAAKCDRVNKNVISLIAGLNVKYWFIENPRAGMRTMRFMHGLPRYTITYCQYGDKRQKYTDIWTNHPNPKFKPPCKNGSSCHEAAPRGSMKGVQKQKNAKERGCIPKELCRHIVDICEEGEK